MVSGSDTSARHTGDTRYTFLNCLLHTAEHMLRVNCARYTLDYMIAVICVFIKLHLYWHVTLYMVHHA